MKKKNRFRTKLLALVMTAALAAVQAPMPVCAEEIPQETTEQVAGTGEITMPEQPAEQSAPSEEPGNAKEAAAEPVVSETADEVSAVQAEPEAQQPAQEVSAPLTEPQPAEEAAAVLEEGEKPAESEELPSEEALAVSAQEVPREEAAGQDAVPEIEAAEIEEPAGDGVPDEVEVDSWNRLQEAFNNASENSESPTRITLSGNVVMQEEINIAKMKFGTNLVVPAGKYVVLDLKGHTIDRKLGSYSSYAFSQYLEIMEAMNVITVSGNLTLEDSSDENTGKITGGYGLPAGGVTVTSGASFTMKGGRITGNKACLAYGHYVGGVYVAKGAQFLMEGGSIDDNKKADGSGGAGGVFVSGSFTMSGNSCITNNNKNCKGTGGVKVDGDDASFIMKGGTIKGNHSGDGQGGGVYVLNGTFEMNDGAIEDNESKNPNSYYGGGGGVYVGGGTFTMRGGRINGNNVSVTSSVDRCGGGGVLVNYSGTFTMEGGSISGNSANVSGALSGGGGVYVPGGTFNMKRSSISGNSVSGSAEQCGGGGVLINYSGTFTMKGGSITGNTADVTGAESGGGGVYSGHGIFTMEGGSITGNNISSGASGGGGVYVCPHSDPEHEKFELSGTPIIRANVKGGASSGEVYTGGTKSNVWLYSDENKKAVIYDVRGLSDGAEIWVGSESEEIVYDASESSVKYLHADDDSLVAVFVEGGYIYLREKTTWPWLKQQLEGASTDPASPTKICMNYDAVAGEGDNFLTVPAGKYVELDLNGFKIDRGLSSNGAKPDGNIITVSGNLTLKDSQGTGILTGGNSTGKAGGVQVSGDGSRFEMQGGRIALNLTVGIGGVWVSENGVFSMTGGEITQNAGIAGGGVGFEGGSFELGGDPKISGNVKGNVIQDGKIVGGKTNNVNVHSGKTISINGAMTNKTPVGVTTVPAPEGEEQIIFTDNWGAYMQGKSPTEFFSSDNEKYSVVVQDGEAALVGHVHKLTYSAEGNTITAVCSGDKNCGFPNHTATLTITAPEHKVYADGASPEAQIIDAYQIQGTARVSYYKADPSGSRSGEALAAAPTDVGRYRAEITLGEGSNSATAFVVYEIEKAVPVYIIPTGLTAVYGQTLEDVKLPVSDNGVWTWAEKEASVGDAGENTFKAVYTPNDADNYKTVTVDVAVTVAKADYTKTSLSASVRYGTTGMIELKDNIPEGGVPGLPKAAGDTEVLSGNAVIIGDVLSCTLKDDRAYVGKVVTVTIPVTSCKNYKDYSLILTLTVKDCSHPATVLKNAKAATCTEKGYSGDLCCRDCNALIKKGEETPIDPSNHDFDYENGVVTREATYLYYGEHTYSCRRDESHKTTRADIEPLPAKDDRDYSDFAEDTKSLSGNEISCNKVEDPVTKAVTETVSIAGEEISKTVTDPVSGKETVTTKVWIGGLREFYTYTGSAIKPSVNVYDGTVKLAEKTDYTVKYSDNKDVGTASITVKFKGNYKDTKSETVKFEIKSAALGTDILAHEIGTAAKKKGSVKVSPILTWADTGKTVSSKYFNIDPSSVKGEGSFTATITPKSGQRNYTGSVTVTIKATGDKNKLINSAKVTFDKKSYAYTGSPIEPKYTLTLGGKTLTEGKDYRRVSLCGNTDPGKGTIVLEAVNGNPAGYVGSKTASFKISGRKELKEDKSFSFTCSDSVPYAKGGARASVTVRDNDNEITLKEGRDYTLSYAKNKAVTNGTRSAEVKIKGKGNYKGSVILKFAVAQQSLSALSENIAAADQFTTKAKLKKPSITITDLDGRKLKAGKDYIVGEKDDRAEGNTESSGVVYITLKGQGDYTGEATAVFRYMQTASSNIGKAKTVKKLQEQTYTGNAVKLSNAELTGVLKLNGNTLEPGKDFKIKGYSNNVKKGKAKVTVQGIGGYGGTKTLTFKIVQRKVTYQGALVGDKFI